MDQPVPYACSSLYQPCTVLGLLDVLPFSHYQPPIFFVVTKVLLAFTCTSEVESVMREAG